VPHPRPVAPPSVPREPLEEILHGHPVTDPYRWLEAPASDPRVRAFVADQQRHATGHLGALPARSWFRDRLAELWDHPRTGAPWRRGTRWFQLRNDGLQDQDVLWTARAEPDQRQDLPTADRWSVLVDPNTWTEDGTRSLSALAVTDDGTRVAIAVSDAGSDWLTWRVVDTASGVLADDQVPWAKFSSAAWLPDDSGFVYGGYDPPEPGQEHAATTSGQRLRLHRLGTAASEDEVVHERPDRPDWGFEPHVSHDGAWLVVEVWRGTDPTTRLEVAAIGRDGRIGPLRPLLGDEPARYTFVGVLDGEVVVTTDLGAPLSRVIAVDLHDPGRRRELVPEHADRLERVKLVGGNTRDDPAWLICRRLHHATARLAVHDARTGRHRHDVPLPGPSTVPAVTGGRTDTAIHLTIETFTAPIVVARHELTTGTTTLLTAPGDTAVGKPASTADLVVEQVLVHHSGVAVPLFLVRRADLTPTGEVPTVLWGYGGFDIPVTPAYRPGWRAWVDAGGLLAVACLRGGGEYGRAWHDDGRLANKQHTFDDALACAAWLCGRDRDRVHATAITGAPDLDGVWTAPDHLGVEGRSNGGLLAAACLTQAPAAFGSVVPEVGVLDLLRFHRFTIGWAWTSDYGDPDDPDDLAVLLRYSPYHRLEPGRAYPATLITTGDTDDRVVPAHSYKFAAALQAAQGGAAPVVLRIDTSAGHGAGKPVGKLLDERADVLAFHAHHLGLVPNA
jgi:prolyl oligopeptidase